MVVTSWLLLGCFVFLVVAAAAHPSKAVKGACQYHSVVVGFFLSCHCQTHANRSYGAGATRRITCVDSKRQKRSRVVTSEVMVAAVVVHPNKASVGA